MKNRKTGRRVLSVVLAVTMIVTLLSGFSTAAQAGWLDFGQTGGSHGGHGGENGDHGSSGYAGSPAYSGGHSGPSFFGLGSGASDYGTGSGHGSSNWWNSGYNSGSGHGSSASGADNDDLSVWGILGYLLSEDEEDYDWDAADAEDFWSILEYLLEDDDNSGSEGNGSSDSGSSTGWWNSSSSGNGSSGSTSTSGWWNNTSSGNGSSGSSSNNGSSSGTFAASESAVFTPGAPKTTTILVYMIGSNLETDGGCATADIQEMLKADLGEDVTLVLQTGGSKEWQNNVCQNRKVQRHVIEDHALIEVSNLGKVSMVERSTLADFIRWGANSYPADRYGLILWDHGGGTLVGFGMDELYDGDLDLTDIAAALNTANVHFDFVGFDACLMGTLETACMLEPYADYLIASEETEPGEGWDYTPWLNALGRDNRMSIPALGKEIVDSFIASTRRRSQVTLSVIDTGEAYKLYGEICRYLAEATEQLTGNGYSKLTAARSSAKDFGDGEYDQIDIRDFVNKARLDDSDPVLAALDATVVYAGTRISNAYGLAMYFPYDYPEYYSAMLSIYNSIGMYDLSLTNFFGKFISALNSTQMSTRGSEGLSGLSAELNDASEVADLSSEAWYEADTAGVYADAAVDLSLNDLTLTEKGDNYVLQLTEEQWENISYIEMWVYADDGEGLIELGSDNFYNFDEDGDLIADFDYNWLALDGSIIPFYAVEGGEKDDGTYYWQGYATAEVAHADGTSDDVEIVLYWGEYEEDRNGVVMGYRPLSESGITLAAKSLRQFAAGDIIVPYCSYYTYDGEYDGDYYFGDVIVWDGDLEVSYEYIGEVTTDIYYYLKDIYNNEYWTETLELSF